MQIKELKARFGTVQLLRYAGYDTSKKRGKQEAIGTMSIFSPPPPELWAKLNGDEKAQLMAWQAERLKALNLSALKAFARDLPAKLRELATAWPAVAGELGTDAAGMLSSEIVKAFAHTRKALKTAA